MSNLSPAMDKVPPATDTAAGPTLRRPAGFTDLVRAELFGLRRRPGVLLMSSIWALQVIVFAYTVLYIVYRTSGAELPPGDADQLITAVLPVSTGSFIVGSLPLYGGPVMLCIGAIISSGDYRFGTLRTLLSRYPDRSRFVVARFLGMATVMFGVAVLTLTLSLVCSGVIAGIEGRPLDYPGLGSLVVTLGAIWLVVTAWGAVGFALGTVTRSVVSAIAIGLVWTLMVENLLFGGLSAAVPVLDTVRMVLLSPSSGSLAYALGASPGTGSSGTPGVVSLVSGPVAVLVLAGYILLSALVAVSVFRRRDVS